MEYVGIDLHKRYAMVARMNEKGKVVREQRVPVERAAVRRFVRALPPDAKLTVEATQNWMAFYEWIEDRFPALTLCHPLKAKAIASARIKTDKLDARTLAHLLRTDLLPTAYLAPRPVRDLRELVRYRAGLVRLQTILKNRVHALLEKTGQRLAVSNLFGKKGRALLAAVKVRPVYRAALEGVLRLQASLAAELAQVEATIRGTALASPEAQLLMTIPGISFYSALLILGEIGEITRFPSPKHLCSYAGLVPSVHSSGGKTRVGGLTKQGSKWLRWILIECGHHTARQSAAFRALARRVHRKHGAATARVAVARQLLRVIYCMLTRQEPFRGATAPRPPQPKVEGVPGQPRGVMVQRVR